LARHTIRTGLRNPQTKLLGWPTRYREVYRTHGWLGTTGTMYMHACMHGVSYPRRRQHWPPSAALADRAVGYVGEDPAAAPAPQPHGPRRALVGRRRSAGNCAPCVRCPASDSLHSALPFYGKARGADLFGAAAALLRPGDVDAEEGVEDCGAQ